ncbi:MAG: hypothetical protein ALECFALPRED_007273 [Alectoria fallacina]|uniref:Uncharacterized protein n=1 Tax=Alectoria fallacina TaxID=1903189 RepID=A0A8H3G7B9_9LECA|nr:MAG: hypothetical protein ALECFALPRED_007273 [Alectoria fallacina]
MDSCSIRCLIADMTKTRNPTSSRSLTRMNSYSPDPANADVSYDAFVSTGSCGAGHKAEIMIWLAAYDLTPISKTGATPHTLNAIPGWNLFIGTNSQTGVPAYSFVARNSPMKTYSGNLMSFFDYLKSANFIDGTEYLQELHAGTEPASGTSVTFTTSSFTLSSS